MDPVLPNGESPRGSGFQYWASKALTVVLQCILTPFIIVYMGFQKSERLLRIKAYNEQFTDFTGGGGARKVIGLLLGLVVGILTHNLAERYLLFLEWPDAVWYPV